MVEYIAELLIRIIIASTPLFIATLGELYTERSGVINLGVEGLFVLGASLSFTVSILTEDLILALISTALVGAVIGGIHGFVSTYLKGREILSGLAITLFAYGLASIIGRPYVGLSLPVRLNLSSNAIQIIIINVFLAIISWIIIFKLKIGILIRACGEDPSSAYVMGVSVDKVRLLTTMLGSSMASIGGGIYTLGYIQVWTEGAGMGWGWIAIANVIVSLWNPLLTPVFSLLYGGINSMIWMLQLPPYNISPYLLGTTPYAVTLLTLFIIVATPIRKYVKPPAALGIKFEREERTI